MKKSLYLLFLVCGVATLPARAVEIVAPDVLAKNVTEEVLAVVRADKDIQAGNLRRAVALVEAKILPHFSFQTMTRLVMGKHWAQASPEQRRALTTEFRTLLVYTYTSSLMLYRNQTIEYRPVKLTPDDTDVVVKSLIRDAGGDPISVDYRMERTDSGWKVYDVKISGISLVENYRTSFSAEIGRSGIDGLIKALAEKNRALIGKNAPAIQT